MTVGRLRLFALFEDFCQFTEPSLPGPRAHGHGRYTRCGGPNGTRTLLYSRIPSGYMGCLALLGLG